MVFSQFSAVPDPLAEVVGVQVGNLRELAQVLERHRPLGALPGAGHRRQGQGGQHRDDADDDQ
ncbi:MAG: hypothetical protein KatS3mg103_1141 [Phycisphaerales bacterium]|nr:MAG: hypothetical protein KatS3mg103_1141 [Phycisphaerales bacterium]